MLLFEQAAHDIVILLLRHHDDISRYGYNIEFCYLLLCLLGHKIFTQPDAYFLLTTALIVGLYYHLNRKDSYSRQLFKR